MAFKAVLPSVTLKISVGFLMLWTFPSLSNCIVRHEAGDVSQLEGHIKEHASALKSLGHNRQRDDGTHCGLSEHQRYVFLATYSVQASDNAKISDIATKHLGKSCKSGKCDYNITTGELLCHKRSNKNSSGPPIQPMALVVFLYSLLALLLVLSNG